jgi:prepilin-type N-terminal cleavage/methylation domain-containing protein
MALSRSKCRPLHNRRNSRSGFTLMEVMIAAAIALVVVGMVTQMTLTISKVLFRSTATLQINRDIRVFTHQVSRDAWSARTHRIFASPSDLTRRESGEFGDVLVLVWAAPESIDTASPGTDLQYFYERVIIYARDNPRLPQNQRTNSLAGANRLPVLRFERRFALPSATESGTKASETDLDALVADILADANRDNENIVVELAEGLADGNLFFNGRTGRSITINGEIFHGNRAQIVSNTYNFTIFPRG